MKKNLGIIIPSAAVVIVIGVIYASMRSGNSQESMGSMNMTSTARGYSQGADTSMEVKSGSVVIDIKNFDFQTATIRVKPGTNVTWVNRDEAKHDIMPDTNNFEGSGKLIKQGESYSYTFNTPGVYSYHCTPHPYMKAKVEVVTS